MNEEINEILKSEHGIKKFNEIVERMDLKDLQSRDFSELEPNVQLLLNTAIEIRMFKDKLYKIKDDSNRATGRTTRLVDYYIQELFNNPNKEIEIIDHHNTQQSNIHLTQMILQRFYNEHKGVKIEIVKQNVLKYGRNK